MLPSFCFYVTEKCSKMQMLIFNFETDTVFVLEVTSIPIPFLTSLRYRYHFFTSIPIPIPFLQTVSSAKVFLLFTCTFVNTKFFVRQFCRFSGLTFSGQFPMRSALVQICVLTLLLLPLFLVVFAVLQVATTSWNCILVRNC